MAYSECAHCESAEPLKLGARGGSPADAGRPTAPIRAFTFTVPFFTVLPWTGWIGGLALPPDTLQHKLPPSSSAPLRGKRAPGGATIGAVACLSAEGWALWVLGSLPALLYSHRGYPPAGERSRRPFWQGLLLGLLGGALGASAPYHSCRRSSGEFRRGKRTGCAASQAHAGRAALPRGLQGPSQ